MATPPPRSAEHQRLHDAYRGEARWRRFGPYLSERQWGTVREDRSHDGDAWASFPHDHARSRAYRWGEDGLLGISDDEQLLCFAIALWNGRDPILKERLFGLTNAEGNHGEDVKELYYYLDSTPTHSWMRALYKYPQSEFPYSNLVDTNAARGFDDPEFELLDTGAFDERRYFDVYVDYAKASPDDVLIAIEVHNRGPEDHTLRLLPTLWFRNTWSDQPSEARPQLQAADDAGLVVGHHPVLGAVQWHVEGEANLLFTENETNTARLFGTDNSAAHVKDGIGRYVIEGDHDAVNPSKTGTKVAADFALDVPAGGSRRIRLRLRREAAPCPDPFGAEFEATMRTRRAEADAFYADVLADGLSAERRRVSREALAGMLWSKQFYAFDVSKWLNEGGGDGERNARWTHLQSHDVLSMPDKWEYPWFAVWDLAFHAIPLMLVDVDFAKLQLSVFLEPRFQRDDGAIPAYEWNFGDVNPPVHAWAVLTVYQFERQTRGGAGDADFLRFALDGLRRNYDWWLDRKAVGDGSAFGGGFLGLDNIGVFDRSKDLPTGGHLEQSDGTSWMVFFAQMMLRLSVEMAQHDAHYEDQATYFLDQVLEIAGSLDRLGDQPDEMWDEEDGFFYDVLRFPDGHATRLKVRSLVGLLPLVAVSQFEADTLERLPRLRARLEELSQGSGTDRIHCPAKVGPRGQRTLAILDEKKLRLVLKRMLDPAEFLSPYGIRSLSKHHEEHPYVFHWHDGDHEVRYLPAESDNGMFGGNSNWRGPIWIPMNYLLLRGLVYLRAYYGDDFTVECPTGSGQHRTLLEVAADLSERLLSIFEKDSAGRRPLHGGNPRIDADHDLRDQLLFYEYFHGDLGAGIGASHQTGWTGCIADIACVFHILTDAKVSDHDLDRTFGRAMRRGRPGKVAGDHPE